MPPWLCSALMASPGGKRLDARAVGISAAHLHRNPEVLLRVRGRGFRLGGRGAGICPPIAGPNRSVPLRVSVAENGYHRLAPGGGVCRKADRGRNTPRALNPKTCRVFKNLPAMASERKTVCTCGLRC